jgi:hypothetical protein
MLRSSDRKQKLSRVMIWSEEWLGGRDSNPDNLLQRQMSYRWTTSQCQSLRFDVANC